MTHHKILRFLALICLLLVLPAQADYRYGMVQDADGWTNMRASASLNSEIVQRVNSGERLMVVGEKGEFYDCMLLYPGSELPEIFGFIHKSRVKYVKSALGAGIVNDPDGWSNLRSGPSTGSSVVRRLAPRDGFFIVLARSGEWCKVKASSGEVGFLHKSRVEWVIPRN